MTDVPLGLVVIVASTRDGRLGLTIGRWFVDRACVHGGFAVAVLDLADMNIPDERFAEAVAAAHY